MRCAGVAEIAYAVDAPEHGPHLARDPLRGARRGGRAALRLPQRRACRTSQCQRLLAALQHAKTRPTKVLMLAGGPDFWSQRHPPQRHRGDGPARGRLVGEHQRHRRRGARDRHHHRPPHRFRAGGQRRRRRRLPGAGRRPRVARARRGAQPALQGHGQPLRLGVLDLPAAAPRGRGQGRTRSPQRRLPMGSQEAVAIGLADARFGHDPQAFLAAAIKRAEAMARDPRYRRHRLRQAPPAPASTRRPSPWSEYREEELARMKLNFYGFDSELPRGALPLRLQAAQGEDAVLPRLAPRRRSQLTRSVDPVCFPRREWAAHGEGPAGTPRPRPRLPPACPGDTAMPPPKAKSPQHATPADTTRAVDDFMAALDHPCKGRDRGPAKARPRRRSGDRRGHQVECAQLPHHGVLRHHEPPCQGRHRRHPPSGRQVP